MTTKDKSPAVQWYPKQYLGDDKVLAMDWDARGMHHWLLNLSWQQEPIGSIPDDICLLRRWLGLPSGSASADRVWARVWPQIRAAWASKDGRWFNAGMVRAAERQKSYHTSRSESAKKRWDTHEMRNLYESTEEEDVNKFFLPDWIEEKPWNEYVKMRAGLRKPMTDHAKRLAIKELDKLRKSGNDPTEVLNQSVARSYQGLFEVKRAHGNVNGTPKTAAADRANRNIQALVLDGMGAGIQRNHVPDGGAVQHGTPGRSARPSGPIANGEVLAGEPTKAHTKPDA